MKLTTKAQYAVMAMVELGSNVYGHPISLPNIAENQNLPLPYLEQLFVKLRRAGLVKSTRGTTGGYTLGRPAAEICIYEVIMATDNSIKATRCNKNNSSVCQKDGKRCKTHTFLKSLEKVIQNFLTQVTLADVCEGKVTPFTLSSFQGLGDAEGARV